MTLCRKHDVLTLGTTLSPAVSWLPRHVLLVLRRGERLAQSVHLSQKSKQSRVFMIVLYQFKVRLRTMSTVHTMPRYK
jgi:hypothetical protein